MAKTIKLDTASKRYAYALYSVAEKSNKIEEIKTEFSHIIEGFMAIPQWVNSTKKSSSSHAQKAGQFLQGISKFNMIPELESFFKVLATRHRAVFLNDIYKEFINIYNIKNNIVVVVIESATELSADEKAKIEEFIKSNNSNTKKVVLDIIINEQLISGFKFVFDAKQYDSSMKTKLDNLKKSFIVA